MKTLLYFIISLFILSSCVFGTSHVGHFDEMVQGTWQINNELRLATFEEDSFNVVRLFNIKEFEGSFIPDEIPDDPSRWVWEDAPDNDLSITWNSNEVFGKMIYIGHYPDTLRESMIVSGFPFSKNKVDTLHRVKIIN